MAPLRGPDVILGTGWLKAIHGSLSWPGPQLKIRPPELAVQKVATVTVTESPLAKAEQRVLEKYTDVFLPPGSEPAVVPFAAEIVLTEDASPRKSPPIRMPAGQLDQLRLELTEYLELGWIRPSTSPWAAPICYVKKPDGSGRLVFDYRKINKQTHDDASPLPRIDDLLARVHGARIFSKIDLKKGYNQVPMAPESIPLTAFVTPIHIKGANHFEWTVLPFGLRNAPPIFQRS